MAAILHELEQQRFLLSEDDGTAEITYECSAEGLLTITHTFVPPTWRGRGVAEMLLRALLGWAERENLRVTSQCGYATAFLARHHEFDHLQPPEGS